MKLKKIKNAAALLSAVLALTVCSQAAAVKPGEPAPDFTAVDSEGKSQTLSSYKGKYVVLEWFNEGCPFVQKHYHSTNMQTLQREMTGKGVVWLSVISSAPGKQGYSIPADANTMRRKWNIASTATLLDPEGKVGRLYGAKTTPDMFIVSPDGKILYMGAIDEKATSNPADIDGAKNYVKAALDEAMAGKPVTTAATTPYGCSVKY